jgi:hypothetical protein
MVKSHPTKQLERPPLSRTPLLRRLRWPVIVFTLALFIGAVLAFRWHDRRSMMTATLEWARLAPFPASARDVAIHTEGNMFTRGFRAHFAAPRPDIDAWLNASPGPREASPPELIAPRRRHFDIKPGGGAVHAELTVDDAAETVDVYVYWS